MSTIITPKKPTMATPSKELKKGAAKKTTTKEEAISKEETLEEMGRELQAITKELIKEGLLKPFDKKYVYGNL